MSDDQHLVSLGQPAERFPNGGGGGASDPGVDLVEHEHRRGLGEDKPEGQHRPGQLPARGDLAERQERASRVGRQLEPHVVAGVRPHVHPEPGLGERERAQVGLHLLGKPRRGRPAGTTDLGRCRGHSSFSASTRRSSSSTARSSWRSSSSSRASASERNSMTAARLSPLAAQVHQELATGPDAGQSLRILLHRLGGGPQAGGDIVQLGGETGEAVLRVGERAAPSQGRSGGGDCVPGAALPGEAEQRRGARLPVGHGVSQAVLLLFQGVFSPGSSRPASSISAAWKRSRSTQARDRGSPPNASQAASISANSARAACSGSRSTSPKRSRAPRCAGRQAATGGCAVHEGRPAGLPLGELIHRGQVAVDVGARPPLAGTARVSTTSSSSARTNRP